MLLIGCKISERDMNIEGYWQGYSDSSGYFEIYFDTITYSFSELSGFNKVDKSIFLRGGKLIYINKANEEEPIGDVYEVSDSTLSYVFELNDTITLKRLKVSSDPLMEYSTYDNSFIDLFVKRKNDWLGIKQDSVKTIELSL